MELPALTKTSKAISSFSFEASASGQKVIGRSSLCLQLNGTLFDPKR